MLFFDKIQGNFSSLLSKNPPNKLDRQTCMAISLPLLLIVPLGAGIPIVQQYGLHPFLFSNEVFNNIMDRQRADESDVSRYLADQGLFMCLSFKHVLH